MLFMEGGGGFDSIRFDSCFVCRVVDGVNVAGEG